MEDDMSAAAPLTEAAAIEEALAKAKRNIGLVAELTAIITSWEPVISAAVLTSTAFRLKDQKALTTALRMQARAVAALERAVA